VRQQIKRRIKRGTVKAGESTILALAELLLRFTWGFFALIIQASLRWPKFGAFILFLIALDFLFRHPLTLALTVIVIVIALLLASGKSSEDAAAISEEG
jgi:hypothetical protein